MTAGALPTSPPEKAINPIRLPTEAEWEYAAGGGDKSESFTYSGSNTINAVAWFRKNSEKNAYLRTKKAAGNLKINLAKAEKTRRISEAYKTKGAKRIVGLER